MQSFNASVASQRLESLLARAHVSVLAAHAHAACTLVNALNDRLPARAVLSIYCTRQKLPPGDARYVGMHAIARLRLPNEDAAPVDDADANDHSPAESDGLLSRGFRYVRDQVAPLSDAGVRAHVETELARATTTLIVLHVRHALRFAAAIGNRLPAHAAIAIYLDEVQVPSDMRAAVYAMAVAQAAQPWAALPAGVTSGSEANPGISSTLDGSRLRLHAIPNSAEGS